MRSQQSVIIRRQRIQRVPHLSQYSLFIPDLSGENFDQHQNILCSGHLKRVPVRLNHPVIDANLQADSIQSVVIVPGGIIQIRRLGRAFHGIQNVLPESLQRFAAFVQMGAKHKGNVQIRPIGGDPFDNSLIRPGHKQPGRTDTVCFRPVGKHLAAVHMDAAHITGKSGNGR